MANALVERYEGEKNNWFKAKGDCIVRGDNEGEIHWCENKDVGAVDRKIVEWYTMERSFKESDLKKLQGKNAVLTESGVLIGEGEIITDGQVVKLLRRCNKLLQEGRSEDFERLILGPRPEDRDDDVWLSDEVKALSESEGKLLWITDLEPNYYVNSRQTVIEMLSWCESNRYLSRKRV